MYNLLLSHTIAVKMPSLHCVMHIKRLDKIVHSCDNLRKQMGQFPFAETITTLQTSLHRKEDTWGRSYDRDLQRQRCKFLQRHE
jgi:hypothetical protein